MVIFISRNFICKTLKHLFAVLVTVLLYNEPQNWERRFPGMGILCGASSPIVHCRKKRSFSQHHRQSRDSFSINRDFVLVSCNKFIRLDLWKCTLFSLSTLFGGFWASNACEGSCYTDECSFVIFLDCIKLIIYGPFLFMLFLSESAPVKINTSGVGTSFFWARPF